MELIAVTLNDPDDWSDHKKMLDYGFTQVSAYDADTSCSTEVSVAGTGKTVGVYTDKTTITLTPSQRQRLERRVLLPRIVYNDVQKGDKLGSIEFVLDGKTVKSVPLYAADSVESEKRELSLWSRFLRFFGIYA